MNWQQKEWEDKKGKKEKKFHNFNKGGAKKEFKKGGSKHDKWGKKGKSIFFFLLLLISLIN